MEFLPAPLAAFLSAHPNIDVDLEHHGSGEIVRAIAAGRGDIGIVGETVDPAAELENFPFAEIRLVLVTPLRHPLSRRRKIAFREALDREFVGFAAGSPMQDLLNYHGASFPMLARPHDAAAVARRMKRRGRKEFEPRLICPCDMPDFFFGSGGRGRAGETDSPCQSGVCAVNIAFFRSVVYQ